MTKATQIQTIDEKIEHLLADHKILLFRYDAHLRRIILQKLTVLQRKVLQSISAIGIEAVSQSVLVKLLRELRQTIAQHYTEVSQFSQKELAELLPLEVNATTQIYNEAVRFDLFNTAPEITKQAVNSAQIIAGSPLGKWWSKQGNDLVFKFEGIIRQGLLDGKQTSELVTDVKALMAGSRRSAETLVRTAVMKVHDTAQAIIRDNNLDILKGEQQISTLDLRTSEVCRVRDGKAWDLDKKPLGNHNLSYARPPLHPNCRSTMRLLTKSWRELGFDIDEIPESTRASMDGQVKQGVHYEDWLNGKTEAEQDQVLGKGKADLWRQGIITFRDMLDQSNRPLTLRDLQQRYTKTWIPDEIYQRISAEIKQNETIQLLRKSYGLTHYETVATKAYSSELYYDLNTNLRQNNLSVQDKRFVAVLNQGLVKLPDEVQMTFRETTLPAEILKKYQVGKIVIEQAFTSSTLNIGLSTFRGNVRFVIHGRHGKLIEDISDFPNEREVLFKDKTRFQVLDVETQNNITIIIMQEI